MLSRVVSMNKNLRPRVASRLTPILKLTLEPPGPARRGRTLRHPSPTETLLYTVPEHREEEEEESRFAISGG